MPSRPRGALLAALAAALLFTTDRRARDCRTEPRARRSDPRRDLELPTPSGGTTPRSSHAEGLNDFGWPTSAPVGRRPSPDHDTVVLASVGLRRRAGRARSAPCVQRGRDRIAMRPDKRLAPLLGLAGGLAAHRRGGPRRGLHVRPRALDRLPPVRAISSWAGQNRDELAFGAESRTRSPRSNDLFFGGDPRDPQPDWVDLDRGRRPAGRRAAAAAGQPDRPVQRHRPRRASGTSRAARRRSIALTGDDHGSGGTSSVFDTLLDAGPAGVQARRRSISAAARLVDVPARDVVRLSRQPPPISPDVAANWNSYGLRDRRCTRCSTADPSCLDFTSWACLNATLTREAGDLRPEVPGPPGADDDPHPLHRLERLGTASPRPDLAHGIRLNTDYYYFPAAWTQRPAGHVHRARACRCASRLRRLADRRLPGDDLRRRRRHDLRVGQRQHRDPQESEALIDQRAAARRLLRRLHHPGPHRLNPPDAPGRNALVADAMQRGVPIVSELQLLTLARRRNASSFQNMTLRPDGTPAPSRVVPGAGANGLAGDAPIPAAPGTSSQLTRNGQAMAITTQTDQGHRLRDPARRLRQLRGQVRRPYARHRVASSFTRLDRRRRGGGGNCEHAGDPGTNPAAAIPVRTAATPAAATPAAATPAAATPVAARTGGANSAVTRGEQRRVARRRGVVTEQAQRSRPPGTHRPPSQRERSHLPPRLGALVRRGRPPAAYRTRRAHRSGRASGKIVRRIAGGRHKAGTVVRLRWDGKDARGRYVAPATYGYSVTAVGSARLPADGARRALNVLRARSSRRTWSPGTPGSPPGRPRGRSPTA